MAGFPYNQLSVSQQAEPSINFTRRTNPLQTIYPGDTDDRMFIQREEKSKSYCPLYPGVSQRESPNWILQNDIAFITESSFIGRRKTGEPARVCSNVNLFPIASSCQIDYSHENQDLLWPRDEAFFDRRLPVWTTHNLIEHEYCRQQTEQGLFFYGVARVPSSPYIKDYQHHRTGQYCWTGTETVANWTTTPFMTGESVHWKLLTAPECWSIWGTEKKSKFPHPVGQGFLNLGLEKNDESSLGMMTIRDKFGEFYRQRDSTRFKDLAKNHTQIFSLFVSSLIHLIPDQYGVTDGNDRQTRRDAVAARENAVAHCFSLEYLTSTASIALLLSKRKQSMDRRYIGIVDRSQEVIGKELGIFLRASP